MNKVIKGILLLLMTVVLALGLHNLFAPDKEANPKPEDNSVVDVLPGDEEQEQPEEPVETLQVDVRAAYNNYDIVLTIEFEEGMTWNEWVNSKYNTHGCKIESQGSWDAVIYDSKYIASTMGFDLTDPIDASTQYYLG